MRRHRREFSPEVLACHAQFGGDLEAMQQLYDAQPDALAARNADTDARALLIKAETLREEANAYGDEEHAARLKAVARIAELEAELAEERAVNLAEQMTAFFEKDALEARLAAQPDALAGSGAGDGALRAELAETIRTRLLGVDPGWQDVELEDADWRLILSALASHPPATGATSDKGGAE